MKISADETVAWLGLYLVPGLGNSAFRRLLEKFGGPEAVFRAGFSELVTVAGVREETARKIVKKQFSSDPEKEIRKVEECNARIVTFRDSRYPPLLKEIHSPPVILYVKGKDIPKSRIFIAIVGSRNATHYGLKTAENIAFGLAARGIGVVSGMAKGIDSAAHKGCLRGKGFTVTVIGTGIDLVYPPENRKLSEEISAKGTMVSEFPTGSPPEPKNFPIRNRLISGLSRGVVVVEATKKSGSLITASMALEQGRDVFAVPGSVDSFKSRGPHLLIKQGASLVENADDILEELGLGYRNFQQNHLFPQEGGQEPELSDTERKLFEIVGDYPVHIDEIVRRSELDTSEVSSALMSLELKGLIRQLMGKRFAR
ncbi:MAG: DNA-protecting protein DprA [Deltaproteobacteria bacterium]|nr:MAG: DNA-protecting protein DprA [Deltaproteobacteria bacterium]